MPHIGTSFRAVVLAALLGAAVPACAPHHVSPQGTAAYDDTTITTRVKTALLNDPQVSALKIDVTTAQGVVTLSGTARNRGEEQKAIQLAKGVQGVKDVKSALQVQ
jgi:hyperosmotically inducible periplasmic protein